nr:hypothetical protein [Streptomyces bauhiniae]
MEPPDEVEPPPDVEVPEFAAAACAVTVTRTLTVLVTVGAGSGFAVSVAVAVAVTVVVAVGRGLVLATDFVVFGVASAPALPTPRMNARPRAGSTKRLRAHFGARRVGGPDGGCGW